MRSRAVLALVLALGAVGAQAETVKDTRWTVESPDGQLAFTLRLDGGALHYTVERGSAGARDTVLAPSPLGLDVAGNNALEGDLDFRKGLRLAGVGRLVVIDETYALPHGKSRVNRHHAHERTFSFVNTAGPAEDDEAAELRLDVVVRVANDGAAFRYVFPEARDGEVTLESEITGFHVPRGATAWMTPHQPPDRYSPAYEEFYEEVAAGTAAPTPSGWSFPALFRIGGGRHWLLISESGLTEKNCGSRLAAQASGGVYTIRMPETREGLGVGAVEPRARLPFAFPWRVLIVGGTLPRVVESTLINDLAPPTTMASTGWIRPGRASWSWWSDDDSPKDEAKLKDFIDLAAEMGWEYSLVDANWNLMPEGTIPRLVKYARSKNVDLILWYNSGGPHNDVTEAPRGLMQERAVRRKEMAKLRDWGVKGIKVDFWQSDKPDRIEQYLDVLKDAADYQILVNFHGSTLPRGWTRTYPHLVSMEGVLGAEQYKFREKFPERAAWLNTVLAFTRNVVGPMDYTPVTFMDKKYPRLTTNAHELALDVVFESGIQHLADAASSYRALPEAAKSYLKAVPAAWDETKLLAGDPGVRAVFARRNGRGWYIGGLNGRDVPQSYELDLSFLDDGAYTLDLITDGAQPRTIQSATRTVRRTDRLPIAMLGRGGFCGVLRPAGQ